MCNTGKLMSTRECRWGGLSAVLGRALDRSTRRWIWAFLVIFALIDGLILLLCPMFGGNCLYGFLTLIAYPVILSGLAGVLLPRLLMRSAKGWRTRALFSFIGAVVLLAVVTICHIAAIRLFNSFDYSGILIRYRLLNIELALSMIYYTALSIIAYASASTRPG